MGDMMAQKNPGYATKSDFKQLKRQVANVAGFQTKMKGLERKLESFEIAMIRIANDLIALNKRVEKMKKRLVNPRLNSRKVHERIRDRKKNAKRN